MAGEGRVVTLGLQNVFYIVHCKILVIGYSIVISFIISVIQYLYQDTQMK